MRKARIGVIGCGNISERYIGNLQGMFATTEVAAVTDLIEANARHRAEQFGVPVVARSVAELLARDDIDIVVNLTNPKAHAEVSRAALLAGKHVYTEKPLATDLDEAKALLDLAAERGLHMTSAPDTYLGAGIQTAHKLLTDGWIGRPFGATAHLTRIPPETWHPDPAFLYHTGAGPLYDSGPYFVAALAYLLGPVVHVMSAAGKTWDTRLITSEPHYGETITVEVPTFVTALLTFASGAIATVLLTTDVPYSRLQDPRQHGHSIELYGTNGTLSVPSPCYFDGLLYYRTAVLEDWAELPTLFTFRDDCRGVGVADLAAAVLTGRPPRVSAALAYHVTEVLQRIEEAGQTRTTRAVESTFERTAPLDPWLRPGEVDPA